MNLTLIKKDAETLLPEPQGAASLDGAEYEATYLHGGEYVTAKGVVENSKLAFEGIPLGTVTIKETKAPAGYLSRPRGPRDNRHSGHGGAANRPFSNTRWPTSSLSRSSEAT